MLEIVNGIFYEHEEEIGEFAEEDLPANYLKTLVSKHKKMSERIADPSSGFVLQEKLKKKQKELTQLIKKVAKSSGMKKKELDSQVPGIQNILGRLFFSEEENGAGFN